MSALPPLVQRPPELMDDPSLDAGQHEEALQALARIHVVSRTASQIAARLVALSHDVPSTAEQPLRILDIACGGGELTTAVATRVARKVPHRVEFIGLDISERAIGWATRDQTLVTENLDVTFRTCDVLNGALPSCTLAFHSLFLHHLDDVHAVAQLQAMAAASQVGFVFSDLLRTRLGLFLAQLGTRVLSRSSIAQIDGPLSVRAARTVEEYHRLFREAQLPDPTLQRAWPERVCVTWSHS
ncbi:MAG: methyltransferase domain-containing protein [Pirellulales bacterium]|nr:methyltransferase domain-containing protein [Pirellulales bacterium]